MHFTQHFKRFAKALLVTTILFGTLNLFHWLRPVTCVDCFFPYGLPFTSYQEGGFGGGEGFVWPGVIKNLLVIVSFAAAYGWSSAWVSGKTR